MDGAGYKWFQSKICKASSIMMEFYFGLWYIFGERVIVLEIKTGYIYHIKDDFFDKINDKWLMINHENGKARPTYFTIKDRDILWFIPLSSKVFKYKLIIERKLKNMVVVNL